MIEITNELFLQNDKKKWFMQNKLNKNLLIALNNNKKINYTRKKAYQLQGLKIHYIFLFL